MRSASFLKEEDLKEGKLPTSNLEMVVYTDDSSKLKTELPYHPEIPLLSQLVNDLPLPLVLNSQDPLIQSYDINIIYILFSLLTFFYTAFYSTWILFRML